MNGSKRAKNNRTVGNRGRSPGEPTEEDDLALITLALRAETMRLRAGGVLKRGNRVAADRLRQQVEAFAHEYLPERLRPRLLLDLEEALVRSDLPIGPV